METEKWVAEYSIIQKCGHVCRLKDSLSLNVGMLLRKKPCQPQYCILFIGNSSDDCHTYLAEFRKFLAPEYQ